MGGEQDITSPLPFRESRSPCLAHRFYIHLLAVLAVAMTLSIPSPAQSIQTAGPQLGKIMGTITDVNGDGVADAKVVLLGPDSVERQKFRGLNLTTCQIKIWILAQSPKARSIWGRNFSTSVKPR